MGIFSKKTAPVEPKTEPRYTLKEIELMGYKNLKDLTEWDVLDLAIRHLPLSSDKIDKKEEEKLFQKLSEVEGFSAYLRETLCGDRDRYFVATSPAEQLNIRGAFSRTLYLRGLLHKKDKKKSKVPGVTRYAE